MINYSDIVLREATVKANNYTGKPYNYMCFNNAGGVEIAKLDFNGPELIFTGDADEAAKILIDYIGNYWATYHRQLKELQEAVEVMIDSGEGTKYHYEVDGSTVDAVLEVLKKQEVSDEDTNSGKFRSPAGSQWL